MIFQEKEIKLKDSRTAILRSPVPEDAEVMLNFFYQANRETPFLLNSPEDPVITVERELAFIENHNSSENDIMLVCLVDGEFAGNCQLNRRTKRKNRHRGGVGIAVSQKFWNLGIGTALFRELIQIARDWGLEQLELEFIEGNERGKALYEKMGFQTIGFIPNAIHQPDGTVLKEYMMILEL